MNLEKLQKLGLSTYESKCYLSLLTYGNLNGKDLAEKSGVPPTSVYRNLNSLKTKGFVQIVQKEPIIYQAISPEIAISSFVKKQKENLDKIKNNTLNELKSLKKLKLEKQEQVLELYTGRTQSYKLGKKLIQNSKKEFLLLGRGNNQSIIDLIHSLKAAAKRGVNCKFIITTYDKNKQLIEKLKQNKIKVKYTPLRGFSLLIKDREEAQIVIKSEEFKQKRAVIRINNKNFSQSHANYFDSLWKKATPI